MLDPLRTLARRALVPAVLVALAAAGVGAQEFRPAFTVVQLNDVYRIDAVESGTAGGLGRIATLVERTRRETRAGSAPPGWRSGGRRAPR